MKALQITFIDATHYMDGNSERDNEKELLKRS